MNLTPFEIVQIAYMTVTVIFGIYVFFSKSSDKDEHRLSGIETRIAVLEEAKKNAITHGDLSNVYERLKPLEKMSGTVESMNRTLTDLTNSILSAGLRQ